VTDEVNVAVHFRPGASVAGAVQTLAEVTWPGCAEPVVFVPVTVATLPPLQDHATASVPLAYRSSAMAVRLYAWFGLMRDMNCGSQLCTPTAATCDWFGETTVSMTGALSALTECVALMMPVVKLVTGLPATVVVLKWPSG